MGINRYKLGDYVKVELPDEATGVGEWLWVQVTGCDEERRFIVGRLDNEPLDDFNAKIRQGSSLVVSYTQIREHRKPTEFMKR